MAPLGDGVAPAAAAAPGLVVSFGEMLIDFVPDVAGVSLAESGGFVKAPGGAPANVACAVSKLGGSSAFVGKVRSPSPLNDSTILPLLSCVARSVRAFYIGALALDPVFDWVGSDLVCSGPLVRI
jgi:fructokinase